MNKNHVFGQETLSLYFDMDYNCDFATYMLLLFIQTIILVISIQYLYVGLRFSLLSACLMCHRFLNRIHFAYRFRSLQNLRT